MTSVPLGTIFDYFNTFTRLYDADASQNVPLYISQLTEQKVN